MTTAARFSDVLRGVEARLTVPQPARSRILHEMAVDLEDLYAAYVARGLGEAEALRRAEQALGASPEAVAELIALHRPAWERLLARYSARGRNRLERMLVSSLALAGVAVGGGALAGQGILQDASLFVWLLLALSGAALLVASDVFFRLYIKQDHRPGRVGAGLPQLLVLATAMVLIAAFGAIGEIRAIADAVVVAAGAWLPHIVPHIRRAAELLSLGLTFALAVLLVWFHLRQRTQWIVRAEAALPFAPDTHPPDGE